MGDEMMKEAPWEGLAELAERYRCEIEKLQADNARLREALERIANMRMIHQPAVLEARYGLGHYDKAQLALNGEERFNNI